MWCFLAYKNRTSRTSFGCSIGMWPVQVVFRLMACFLVCLGVRRTLAEGLVFSAMSRATAVGPLSFVNRMLSNAGLSKPTVGGVGFHTKGWVLGPQVGFLGP
jgi:hypothetical protein